MLSVTLAIVPRTGERFDDAVDCDAIALESDRVPDVSLEDDVSPLEQPRTAPAARTMKVAAALCRTMPKLKLSGLT
ncbi:MAG: hypothetical protein V4529_13140 [Gemmatimonadota bacterium]